MSVILSIRIADVNFSTNDSKNLLLVVFYTNQSVDVTETTKQALNSNLVLKLSDSNNSAPYYVSIIFICLNIKLNLIFLISDTRRRNCMLCLLDANTAYITKTRNHSRT